MLCVQLYDHSFLCVRAARRYKEVPLAAVFTGHKESDSPRFFCLVQDDGALDMAEC